jgi:hypothetical protein
MKVGSFATEFVVDFPYCGLNFDWTKFLRSFAAKWIDIALGVKPIRITLQDSLH